MGVDQKVQWTCDEPMGWKTTKKNEISKLVVFVHGSLYCVFLSFLVEHFGPFEVSFPFLG